MYDFKQYKILFKIKNTQVYLCGYTDYEIFFFKQFKIIILVPIKI